MSSVWIIASDYKKKQGQEHLRHILGVTHYIISEKHHLFCWTQTFVVELFFFYLSFYANSCKVKSTKKEDVKMYYFASH